MDKQHRITTATFRSEGDDPNVPDAYVDPQALAELKKLAGIDSLSLLKLHSVTEEKNISNVGTDKGAYMRKHNIKSGTDEWFKLWFSRTGLTGEKPTPKDS